MPHLHIDAFSGISGDMLLGAFVDLGVPLAAIKRELRHVDAQGYRLKASRVHRGPLSATKVDVHVREGFKKPLSLAAIRRLIRGSRLAPNIQRTALDVFQRIAEAESHVHGVPLAKVHFHEVGVIDSLVDILGALIGFSYLEATRVTASPVNVGAGRVETAHGTLPVPVPAVSQLAIGHSVFSAGPMIELTTPTGMAILSAMSQECVPFPSMTVSRVGHGAGTANPEGWPNVLRMFLGEPASAPLGEDPTILEIQTTIDDMNPQLYEVVMDRLLAAGARDVTFTPVIMKRQRPGTVITVLADAGQQAAVNQILFHETSTLGVRFREVHRMTLRRTTAKVALRSGVVRVKVAALQNGQDKMMPEYQDCRSIADRTGLPVQTVMDEARRMYHEQHGPRPRRASAAPSRSRRKST